MVVYYFWIFVDQELVVDWEVCIFFGLWNVGFLQQGQCCVVGVDKDKFGFNDLFLMMIVGICQGDCLVFVGVVFEVMYYGVQLQGEIIMFLQIGDQLVGNFIIVDVGFYF